MQSKIRIESSLAAALLAASLWLTSGTAHAVGVGGHVGLNLDHGDVHLGLDVLVPVAQVSPAVTLALWPSLAHVFRSGHDVELLGLDLPFMFQLDSAPLVPFVGPGVGLAIHDKLDLKLNVVTGAFLETRSPVRPFAELALRFINGVFVDLLFGAVVEL